MTPKNLDDLAQIGKEWKAHKEACSDPEEFKKCTVDRRAEVFLTSLLVTPVTATSISHELSCQCKECRPPLKGDKTDYSTMPPFRAALQKWSDGQRTYGATFIGDPLKHFYEEQLDAFNYLAELENQGRATDHIEVWRQFVLLLMEETWEVLSGKDMVTDDDSDWERVRADEGEEDTPLFSKDVTLP